MSFHVFELTSQKHIQHKNHRIKDQILTVLSQLTDIYASDIVALSPQLVPKLAQLLSDPNSSTRSLCSTLLGQLYENMGEGLIVSETRGYLCDNAP